MLGRGGRGPAGGQVGRTEARHSALAPPTEGLPENKIKLVADSKNTAESAVLWIRIRSDPKLFAGSGSGLISRPDTTSSNF